MRGDSVQVIFGLKLRQFREEKGWGLKEFSERAGLSPSYLNEIEKGKKYPKADKIMALADTLGVGYDELVSLKLDKELNLLESILDSPVVRELPLQLFGISQHDVINLLTKAPHEAGALVRTLVEIARSYDMQVEHFLHAMLRSYQESHDNYFEDIEKAVAKYVKAHAIDPEAPVSYAFLRQLLLTEHRISVDEQTLDGYPELAGFRSVWIDTPPPRLLVNGHLTPSQKAFQVGRELGYRALGLTSRGITSSRAEVTSFDQVLNDFRASYFAGALLINEKRITKDIRGFFRQKRWDGERFLAMMAAYDVTPEIFMYRLSQVVPRHMGLKQLHFLRFNNSPSTDSRYRLSKQFNMSQVPIPTGIGLDEHYCRRWLSVEILQELAERQRAGNPASPVVGVQVSRFLNQKEEYLCIALARPLALTPDTNTSVTLGFRMTDEFKEKVRFWDDDRISHRELNETCERCPLSALECSQRAAPPSTYRSKERLERRKQVLDELVASSRPRPPQDPVADGRTPSV
ncbi:MAG: helix-turn-helix domain-containing protein [Candidatus Lambdaproteobacteria bacterium]|nr:helix-turn-helix domain-containing protein [Candidatus Lambdaproteobacteria bacterium]